MTRRPLIAWLLLGVAVAACGVVLAPGVDARERPPPSVEVGMLAVRQPGVIDRGPPLPLQPPGSPIALTLADLQRIAEQYNPTLVQAGMAVRAAQGKYLQARLYPNPSIGYLVDEAGNEGRAGLQGASVRQEIVTGGKLRLKRAVAGHEVHQARYARDAQQRRVFNDVRAGYYEVLLAQELIDVNRQLVRIGDESLDITQRREAALDASRVEVLQVGIEAEKARLRLEEAESRYRMAWRHLAAVLGQPQMEPALLAGNIKKDLPALSFDDALRRLMAESPQLGQARAKVERARCELARQYAQRVPNLRIQAAAKYDHATEFAVADVAVSLPLPLFDRNQGNIIRARADLIAAENEVRRIELDLYDRFSTAFGEYAIARRQADVYDRIILPNAKTSWDKIKNAYRDGEFGYLTLLTAQRTFFNASLEYLARLRQLWARTVELEGMLLSGGLQRIDR